MFENFDIWLCIGKIIDAILLIYIPARIFPLRESVKHKQLLFSLSCLLISMILYGFDILFVPSELLYTLILWVSLSLIYICLFFRAKFYLKMIIQCACVCCTMLMHFVVVTFLSLLTGAYMLFSWQHILIELILLPLLARYLFRFSYIPRIDLPSRFGISMAALMLILTLVMNAVWSLEGTVSLYELEIKMIVFAIVFYLYYLFFSMIREYEEHKLLTQQINLQKKHLNEYKETYNDIRFLRHELKNHVFYMNNLLEQKNYDTLKDYFKQIYHQEYAIDMIESGNNAINTVLNQKVIFAKSKNITVTIGAALPETLEIDESHICAVISNLLDNAIEACEHLSNPEISMTVRQKGEYIHIACKNTVDYDVLKHNAALKTTKQTPNHGIGLQVVLSIVKTYDGMIDFRMEELTFVVNAMLKTGL